MSSARWCPTAPRRTTGMSTSGVTNLTDDRFIISGQDQAGIGYIGGHLQPAARMVRARRLQVLTAAADHFDQYAGKCLQWIDKTIAVTGLLGDRRGDRAAAPGAGARIVGFDRNAPGLRRRSLPPVDLSDPARSRRALAGVEQRFDALMQRRPACRRRPTSTRCSRSTSSACATSPTRGGPARRRRADRQRRLPRRLRLARELARVKAGLATPFADADAWIAGQDVEGAPSYHLSKELVIAWTLANCQRGRRAASA